MSGKSDQWSLLVPVKRLQIAKTRLALADGPRADLALAMACDTVAAALAADFVAEVVIITDDKRAAGALADLGARVIGDLPDAGLNPALVHGASAATMTFVAALSSDLPALRSTQLDAVLWLAAAQPRAVVADHSGTGTTLLTARSISDFSPEFGVDSRAAHISAGAVDLTAEAGASLRQDVDTLEGLQAALHLGVGPRTTQALAGLLG